MTIVLSQKAHKLLTLLGTEGYDHLEDLVRDRLADSLCPAICMTEGCNHVAEMEPDQDQGHCEACGGQTMTSALVLAEII